MKYALSLFSLMLLVSNAIADVTPKKYSTTRLSATPKIDGKLDDAAWQNIAPISSFVDALPAEGVEPSQRTEIKIIYDDQAIYIAGMMFDTSPDSVLHEFGNRDDGDLNADKVRIVFDTYNTRADAYEFGLYASGVQADLKFSDETFDAVWQSATQLNSKGWSFEMKIPYSAIRFPNSNEQLWAMQITRSIRRNHEFIQWNLTPKADDNPFKYWGTLEGLKDIKPPLRLSLTPYVSTYVERTPVVTDSTTEYSNTISYRAGADIKYGIDERFTLDMTLLPDFGQVKSDDKVKNLGYSEIVYDENRPFFKEGIELFDHFGLFYSRRIAATPSLFYDVPYLLNPGEKITDNPSQAKLLNATKLTGRTDHGTGIGILNAITDNTYATVEDENGTKRKILTEPFTNFNVISLDQQLKNNSTIYFINLNTMRSKKYDDANVTGAGYSLANKKNSLRADGSFAVSQIYKSIDTIENNFMTQVGYKYFIGFQKTGGKFQYGISRSKVNKSYYGSDLGNQSLQGFNNNRVFFTWQLLKPFKKVQEANASVTYDIGLDDKSNSHLTRNEAKVEAFVLSRDYNAAFGGVGLTPTTWYDYYEARVPGRYYTALRYYYFYVGISTDYRKKLAIDMTNFISNFIDKYTWFGWNNETTIRYRFSDKLSVNYKFIYNYDPFNIALADNSDEQNIIFGGRVLNTYINQLSARYIFKNDLSLNVNARHYWITGEYKKYFTLENNGEIAANDIYDVNNDFNYNVMNVDAVFSWQFAPGSNISLAYKFSLEHQDYPAVKIPSFGRNFEDVLNEPQTNSISLRALYYLDWSYLMKHRKKK